MEKKITKGPYISSYVLHEDKWFFISTINRLCSSGQQIMFSETMVWEWDNENKKRGKPVGEYSCYAGSTSNHYRIIEGYYTNGKIEGDFNDCAIESKRYQSDIG